MARFTIMMALALTCSPCIALPQHSMRADVRILIKRQSQRVIHQSGLPNKWRALADFNKLLVDFENQHDLEIDVDSRIDLAEMEDALAGLPDPETFMKSQCADYRDSFLLHVQLSGTYDETKTRKDFDYYEEIAAKILDGLCR